MNASKAEELGIENNEWVDISSSIGTVRGQIMVTEMIHPEALFFPGGYGNRTPYFELSNEVGGVSPNDLMPFQMEPISGHAMLQDEWVTVTKI
jgi:thiosulfate reductase/polysulfide reductase chain A